MPPFAWETASSSSTPAGLSIRHEHWAIIGANGSGKSLLADALRGRLPLVQGELRYHFTPPPGLTAEESIGHVAFEDRKADVHETVVQSRWNSLEEEGALLVRDFLGYDRVMEVNPFEVSSRHDKSRPQFERRRRRAVALLRVAPFLDRRLISLSNGERQRVQLARALSRPLRLLILDEPFVGLDAANRKHFHAVLEQLMGTSLRVLLITTRAEDLPRHVTHLLRVDQLPGGRRRAARAIPREPERAAAPPCAEPERRASRLKTQDPGLQTQGSRLRLVEMRNVTVRYGNPDHPAQRQLDRPRRRKLGPARPQRLRQDHPAQPDPRGQPAGLHQRRRGLRQAARQR